jgi:sortase A
MMRTGIVILLFVVYQLWGTGLTTARAQNNLSKEFTTQIAEFTPPSAPAEAQPVVTAQSDLPIPELGDPIARITMKSIDSTNIKFAFLP